MLIFYSVITGNCFRGIVLNRFKWQVYKDNQPNWTCGRWYWIYVYLRSSGLIAYFAIHLLFLEQMVIYNYCDTLTGWHSKHSFFLWIYEEESKANKQTKEPPNLQRAIIIVLQFHQKTSCLLCWLPETLMIIVFVATA